MDNVKEEKFIRLIETIERKNAFAAVDLIGQKDIDLNRAAGDGDYLIHKALEKGLLMVFFTLIEGGANIDVRNKLGQTALFIAGERGLDELVKLLLTETGADPGIRNFYGQSALHAACFRKHKSVAVLLIDALIAGGGNIDVPDDDGNTPLYAACYCGAAEIVKILLKNGASPAVKNLQGLTPLTIAAQRGHGDIVTYLMEEDPYLMEDESEAVKVLGYMSAYGRLDLVKRIRNTGKGISIDAADEMGKTPLMYACQGGFKSMITFLLEQGADVHACDRWGHTALSTALMYKQTDIVDELLALDGHMLNREDPAGYTALHYAYLFQAEGGSGETARIIDKLIGKGADIKAFWRGLPLLSQGNDKKGKERVELFMFNKVKEVLNRGVDPEIMKQSVSLMRSSNPVIDVGECKTKNPPGYKKFMALRMKRSNTLRVGFGSGEQKNQAIDAWLKVDAVVREWALAGKDVTGADLFYIHKILELHGDKSGRCRRINGVRTGNPLNLYVPYQFIEAELEGFISRLHEGLEKCRRQKENPVVLAARTEQFLISLHPFENGNGRMARIMMDYVLQRFRLPPAVLRDNHNTAVFGLVPPSVNPTPTDAVKEVMEGINNSYRLLL